MKKNVALMTLLCSGGLLFFASSCKKLVDYTDCHKTKPGKSDTLCHIMKITSYGYATPEVSTLTFKYNRRGDPDSIITDGQIWKKNLFLFRYDSLGRMIHLEVINMDPPSPYGIMGGVRRYSDFSYNQKNNISSEANTEGVQIISGRYTFKYTLNAYITYSYDSLNRIIKTVWRHDRDLTPHVTNYTYSPNGNLSTYSISDNKMNLFRTHKIWQFLARDYSRNNPLTGASYNQYDLPIETRQTNTGRVFFGYNETVDHATIDYDCQVKSRKAGE